MHVNGGCLKMQYVNPVNPDVLQVETMPQIERRSEMKD